MEGSGKPQPGFPLLSTVLGNRRRDSHISTAPATARLIQNDEKEQKERSDPQLPPQFFSRLIFRLENTMAGG
jgi:hypothetical protein